MCDFESPASTQSSILDEQFPPLPANEFYKEEFAAGPVPGFVDKTDPSSETDAFQNVPTQCDTTGTFNPDDFLAGSVNESKLNPGDVVKKRRVEKSTRKDMSNDEIYRRILFEDGKIRPELSKFASITTDPNGGGYLGIREIDFKKGSGDAQKGPDLHQEIMQNNQNFRDWFDDKAKAHGIKRGWLAFQDRMGKKGMQGDYYRFASSTAFVYNPVVATRVIVTNKLKYQVRKDRERKEKGLP